MLIRLLWVCDDVHGRCGTSCSPTSAFAQEEQKFEMRKRSMLVLIIDHLRKGGCVPLCAAPDAPSILAHSAFFQV
jgi:hypothetical protein